MRSKGTTWAVILIAIVGGAMYAGRLLATPSSGFSATTVALGHFDDIDVNNLSIRPDSGDGGLGKDLWLSMQKTKGRSDVYVQRNEWALGGTSGWHTHPGHSLIIVTEGELTAYDGDDPTCTPHRYTPGMGFVDAGGDHFHLIRNEGSVIARGYAVQLIPAGATRRIDAAGPAGCPF